MADNIKIALILTAVDKASAVFDRSNKKIQAGLSKLNSSKDFFNKYGNYATLAGGVAVGAFTLAIHAAEENEIAVKRLEQVYKSMGQNVEQASRQSQEYASKLQMQIGVEDEAILAVQAKLATFKKISDETARMNGHFERATALAFDMQATGFGDAAMNAVQLGKALQDPVKGINALRRSGISFTEAEKKRIAALVASNKVTKAQELILKAIEKQVGGVAKATTTASARARVAWSEVTESIGKAVLPAFTRFIEKVAAYIPKIQAWVEQHGKLIKILAVTSVAVLALGLAMKVIAFGIGGIQAAVTALNAVSSFLLANPIVLIIAAIAAAAYLIYKNWGGIANWFANLWAKVKAVFMTLFRFLKKIFWDYSPAVLIYRNWDKVAAFFGTLWAKVKAKFHQFMAFIFGLPARMWQAGREMVNSIWEGIKSKWGEFKVWVEAQANWLKKTFYYNRFGGSSPAAQKAAQAGEQYNIMMNRAQPSVYSPSSSVYNPVSKSNTQLHYAPVINVSGAATQADADLINSTTQRGFDKMMQKYNNNKQRTGYNN